MPLSSRSFFSCIATARRSRGWVVTCLAECAVLATFGCGSDVEAAHVQGEQTQASTVTRAAGASTAAGAHAMAATAGAGPQAGTAPVATAGAGAVTARPVQAGEPATLPAVAPDADGGGDAGVMATEPEAPSCSEAGWVLARGFVLAERVDYVADRDDRGKKPLVLSGAGVPCASAHNHARCMTDLGSSTTFGRYLATTAGDSVRFWPLPAAFTLLGAIDTEAEAIWVLSARGYDVPCDVTWNRIDGGYLFEGLVDRSERCGGRPSGDAGITVRLQTVNAVVHHDATLAVSTLHEAAADGCSELP